MSAKTTGSVVLVLVIALSIFISASVLVNQVNIEDVPALLLPVWSYIVAFFNLAPVLTAIGFALNIAGYLKNYFQTNYAEQYDFKKLGETLTLYIGVITGLLSAATTLSDIVPEPYGQYLSAAIAVGSAIIVILDLVKKQLAELGQTILTA